jgi:hypothetical protein
MSLDKTKLNKELQKAYTDSWNTFIGYILDNFNSANPSSNPRPAAIEAAAKVFADQISTSIDNYIKSSEIIIPPGIVVAYTGTPPVVAAGGDAAAQISNTVSKVTYQSIIDSPKAKIS